MPKSFLKGPLKLITISAVLFIAGCAGKPVAGNDWPRYMQNDARTNYSPDKVEVPLALLWTKDVSDFRFLRPFPKEQLASPAVSNKVLFAASTNKEFYALDLEKGKVLWTYDAEYPLEGPPAVGEGMVCFGSANGILRCLDAKEGKPLWEFQARSEILSSPIIRDGKVYFSSSDDKVYALSARDGRKIWTYNRTTFQTVAPRVYGSSAYHNGKLFHFFSDGFVVAISAESGKEIWKRKTVKNFDTSDSVRRTPMIANDFVYVMDEGRGVLTLEPESGEVKNSYNVIKAQDFIVLDKRTLVLAGGDQIIALDMLSGSILWKKDLEYKPLQSLFAADGVLFMLSNYTVKPLGFSFLSRDYGRVEALSLKNGQTLWGKDLKSTISANGSAGQTRMALVTNKGIVEVFGPK